MKLIRHEGKTPPLELQLTERNLRTLLEKLTMPDSARTLIDPEELIAVVAVPDHEHYAERAPGLVLHADGSIG